MPLLILIILLLILAFFVTFFWLVVRVSSLSSKVAAIEGRLREFSDNFSVRCLQRRVDALESATLQPAQPQTVAGKQADVESVIPKAAPIALESPPLASLSRTKSVSEVTPPSAQPEYKLAPLEAPPAAEKAAIEEPPRQAPAPSINWERFFGANLFAWVGALALFLGVAFFIKYAFERNLIPAEVRIALGFLLGIGLLAGGLLVKKADYVILRQTLCGAGVLILYGVSFASHALYHFIGRGPTFGLMIVITIAAFLLADRLSAMAVAVLGLLGGFLAPLLLSSGIDQALGLFSYVALLDIGLCTLALKHGQKWHPLALLGVLATLVMQVGWAVKFFEWAKIPTLVLVLLAFGLLSTILAGAAKRFGQWGRDLIWATYLPVLSAFFFSYHLIESFRPGTSPAWLFALIFGTDLCVLAAAKLNPQIYQRQWAAGLLAFLGLGAWMLHALETENMYWAIGASFLFGCLHTLFPILNPAPPELPPKPWAHYFPAAALLLLLAVLLQEHTLVWLFWPVVACVGGLAVVLALVSGSLGALVASIVITGIICVAWLALLPTEVDILPSFLAVVIFFALFFFGIGVILLRHKKFQSLSSSTVGSPLAMRRLPALAAAFPYLLLILAAIKLPLVDPTPLYGVAMLLAVLITGLSYFSRDQWLAPAFFLCTLLLQYTWYAAHFSVGSPSAGLLWSVVWYAFFSIVPLLRPAISRSMPLLWKVSALSGPLHFFLIYKIITLAWPNDVMGLLPALMALPPLGLLYMAASAIPFEPAERRAAYAWFGGSALFFITLVFPIQFDRQWLTVSWALEGFALVWLYRRVPHEGLKLMAVSLLLVTFIRLGLNQEILTYYPRNLTSLPILNWMLYAYGTAIVCLALSARSLTPPEGLVLNKNVQPLLYALAVILAFMLLNIEIADFFSSGTGLTFDSRGSLAQGMTYSISWALFALGLIATGVAKRIAAARYAGMALMLVTLMRLFFHDLVRLGALYRIGAFMIVAIISIAASTLYQRFFAASNDDKR